MKSPMSEPKISETVLFVDDEENILKSIQCGLMDEPFPKRFAQSGEEALEIFRKEPVAVIVTDMRMPRMGGLELLTIVKEEYPETVRIILTSYAHVVTVVSAINTGQVYRYLIKPWKMEAEFIPTIRQAIEHYRLLMERKSMITGLRGKNLQLNKVNAEIQLLINQVRKSDARKTEIIHHLTQEIIPYILEIVSLVDGIQKENQIRPAHVLKGDFIDLSERGGKILSLLTKVENLLKEG